jgi:hypothetical protein
VDPGHPGVVAYIRRAPVPDRADDALLVVANLSPESAELAFDALPWNLPRHLLSAGGGTGTLLSYVSELTLCPWGWIIFDLSR